MLSQQQWKRSLQQIATMLPRGASVIHPSRSQQVHSVSKGDPPRRRMGTMLVSPPEIERRRHPKPMLSFYAIRHRSLSISHVRQDDDAAAVCEQSSGMARDARTTTTINHSSQSGSKIAVSSMKDRWHTMTQRLLGSDNSLLSDAEWAEAIQILQHWLEHKNLSKCWKVLDKLQQDKVLAAAAAAADKQSLRKRRSLSTIKILNPILKLWKEELQHQLVSLPSSPNKERQPVWPSQVSARLFEYKESGLVHPDKFSHCIIMGATTHLQKHVPKSQGVEFADAYLRRWIHEYRLQDNVVGNNNNNVSVPKPDSHAVGIVIRAWSESKRRDSPQLAEDWLNDPMIKKLGILNDPHDVMILYTSVMVGWARVGNPYKVTDWMNRMLDENRTPDPMAWSALVKAWTTFATLPATFNSTKDRPAVYPITKEERFDAAERAEKFIDEMELEAPPPESVYNTVLEMWSMLADMLFHHYRDKVASRMAAERAHAALTRMENLPEKFSGAVGPGPFSYHTVLTAFCRSQQPQLAEKLLSDMIEKSASRGNLQSALEGQYFSTVIWGWSLLENRDDIGERGEDLLAAAKACGVVPDSVMYCACINCWAKAAEGKGNFVVRQKAIERSEKLLSEMKLQGLEWTSFAFSEMLKVYANCNELEKAQDLVDAWLSDHETTRNPALAPSAVSFTPILSAFARSNGHNAADNALKVLRKMQRHKVKPNDFSYAAVIKAFAISKAGDGAGTALQLFDEMRSQQGIEPSIYSWAHLLTALVNHGRSNEAEKMLEEMISGNGAQPNVFVFGSVLTALSKCAREDAVDRAMSLLNRMHHLYDEKLILERPNRHCCNAVLACMARSDRLGMAEEAEAFMHSMTKEYGVSPDSITLHTVMNAWANEGNWSKVLWYYQQVQEYQHSTGKGGPNRVTLGTLWKGALNAKHLSPSDKVHTLTRLTNEFAKLDIHPTRGMQEERNKLLRRIDAFGSGP